MKDNLRSGIFFLNDRRLRERRFETLTWQEPIKQDRNSGQLFRPSWDSSVLCSELKRCVAPALRANAHKLQNDRPFTIWSSVLWTYLRPETRVITSRVLGRKVTVSRLRRLRPRKAKNNCGQPKHLNHWWPSPCFENAARRTEKTYFRKYIN